MKFLRRFWNTLREGLKGIWKHKNLGVTSVISIFFTLFITGIILIGTITINNVSLQIQSKVNDVEIFIKNGVKESEVSELEYKLKQINIPKTVKYRSPKEAYEIMKKSWGEKASLLDDIDYEGVLPASYVVKLENIDQTEDFVKEVKKLKSVEDINYYKDLVTQVSKLSHYSKLFGTILVIVLMVISLFIIGNTIRSTVLSRIQEIAVMRNVGATKSYILIPFLIEGIFYSLLASALSFCAIYYSYIFVYNKFGTRIVNNLSIISLIHPEVFKYRILVIFLALGLGIGVLGSIVSIRRYLLDREVNYVK